MRSTQFVATRLDADEATNLWERSDEASAFTRPDSLARLVEEVEWWGVVRSGKTVAAWPLVRPVRNGPLEPAPFSYYVGPLFDRSLRRAQFHRYWSLHIQMFSALISAITDVHESFRFSMPPGLSDVRPLEWWNHCHPDRPGFAIQPRYTARIDVSSFPDEDALRRSFARIKRRDIKAWADDPPQVVHDVPHQRVIELHDAALHRSGGSCDDRRHTALRRTLELADSGFGATVGVVPKGADQPEAVVVLLDGPTESNNVLCVASSTGRAGGLTSWATWLGIQRAKRAGKRWFDFNGANSPTRAADKHFYGAREQLYFDIRFGACGR